jgi:hypothetical protein
LRKCTQLGINQLINSTLHIVIRTTKTQNVLLVLCFIHIRKGRLQINVTKHVVCLIEEVSLRKHVQTRKLDFNFEIKLGFLLFMWHAMH